MTFQFPTRRARSKRQREPYAVNPETPEEEELTGLVQGLSATDIEERVARALDLLNLEYYFQYNIFGGRQVKGGYVVDFLVLNPFGIPLETFGAYWHSGQFAAGDRLKLAILFNQFGIEPLIVWGNQAETQEQANATIRRLLG